MVVPAVGEVGGAGGTAVCDGSGGASLWAGGFLASLS